MLDNANICRRFAMHLLIAYFELMKNRIFTIVYFVTAMLVVIVSSYFRYKTGSEMSFITEVNMFFKWVVYAVLATICLRVVDIFYPGKNKGIYISLLLLIFPLIYNIGLLTGYSDVTRVLYCINIVVQCGVLIYVMIKISSKSINELRVANGVPTSEILEDQEAGGASLGQGDTNLDIVIRSLRNRSLAAQRTSTVSLVFMIFILIVGGGASIGTTALDELKKVREIELERNKLLRLNEQLVEATTLVMQRDPAIDSLVKTLYEQYGNDKSYEIVLQKIERRSQNIATGWQDLAMRISIAVLSLFLVQVFFHIYKFNQQQYSHLLAK